MPCQLPVATNPETDPTVERLFAKWLQFRIRSVDGRGTHDVRRFARGEKEARLTRRHQKSDSGAALVEMAIILPLLLLLLFGLFTGGIALERRSSVAQAARESARYGATVAQLQCTPVVNCGGRTWAEQTRSVGVSRAGNGVVSADVCVALVEGSGAAPTVYLGSAHYSTNGTAPCYADGSADTGLRVQVRIAAAGELNGVFLRMPLDLTAQATAKYEKL